VSVTLSGKVDYSKLNYSSHVTHAAEGDIVIF
jgi:hypothetical protein